MMRRSIIAFLFVVWAAVSGAYDWINGPWPWEYDANKEG